MGQQTYYVICQICYTNIPPFEFMNLLNMIPANNKSYHIDTPIVYKIKLRNKIKNNKSKGR